MRAIVHAVLPAAALLGAAAAAHAQAPAYGVWDASLPLVLCANFGG